MYECTVHISCWLVSQSRFNVAWTGLPLLTTDCVHSLNTSLGLITSPPSSLAVSVYVCWCCLEQYRPLQIVLSVEWKRRQSGGGGGGGGGGFGSTACILTCHFFFFSAQKTHTSRALILCLSMEFAVWAEGDEYNGEKIEERSEGEWGWRRVRGWADRTGDEGEGGRLSWCLHRALSHRLSPVSHAWPL